ncbi:MAG: TIM barrel protein, partial [Acidobacteria bacterium]|nr:TIM barrel protein [Acidobacteriota bacterium]
GMPDSEGLENCVTALKQIVGHAEQKGVTICMELLNSKVNHADYMADNMPWLVELVDRVGSDRFKILYDIYHAQVMEGDVIRTIRDYHQHIGHYHTAGNPGRNELDENQELFYPAIMRAILETGYTGIVGQEFIPKSSDKLAALAHGVSVCDV